MTRIDTHQHLIYPDRFDYDWLENAPALQADAFRLEHYRDASAGLDIAGSVFMEVDVNARHSAAESRFFCEMAEGPASGILAVIAAGRPEQDDFEQHLDAIAHPRLAGLRRVLHVAPDETSRSETFRSNMRLLGQRDLSFDLCLRADQLPLAPELLAAAPDTRFVLDHCGNPPLDGSDLTDWKNAIALLAEHDNLSCKLSGLPVNCPPGEVTAETLRPGIEFVLKNFGWDRVLWGGDWPVCTLNGTLSDWTTALDQLLAEESPANLEKLYTANARTTYRLGKANRVPIS